MSEQMCAHLHIEYHTLKNLDGSTYGWWQCDDCETKFIPETMVAKLEDELKHAIKQYEEWEKEIEEQDKELNEIEALLIKLRNFVVKAEGHWLYGERWTDWIDKHLPKEKLIE